AEVGDGRGVVVAVSLAVRLVRAQDVVQPQIALAHSGDEAFALLAHSATLTATAPLRALCTRVDAEGEPVGGRRRRERPRSGVAPDRSSQLRRRCRRPTAPTSAPETRAREPARRLRPAPCPDRCLRPSARRSARASAPA